MCRQTGFNSSLDMFEDEECSLNEDLIDNREVEFRMENMEKDEEPFYFQE